MKKKHPLFRWKSSEFTFERRLAQQTFKARFPMSLQQFIISFGFAFIQMTVNSYGEAMTVSQYVVRPCGWSENTLSVFREQTNFKHGFSACTF